MSRSSYISTVGKVIAVNLETRLLTVDLGQRIASVIVPQRNGIYFPQVNDLIEVEGNGHNLILKHALLYNTGASAGSYNLNCSEWNVTKNGGRMFAIFGTGYSV